MNDHASARDWPPFFQWLVVAALADWLITRTFTRSAIFMPKSPPVIVVYQALTLVGQLAVTLTSLLALVAVGWIAFHSWRACREFGLPMALLGLMALSLFFLVVPAEGWLMVGYHLLVIAAVGMIGWRTWSGAGEIRRKIVWSLPALALLAGGLYQLSQTLFAALRWPGPPLFAAAIFNVGELIVALSPVALWWAVGPAAHSSYKPYAWAALPTLAFSAAYLANPSLTGIIAIWSTGLTLYLPWPVYAVSVWLASVTVIASRRRGHAVGWAILLLAAGGYAPQLSTQVFLGLIALWQLATSETRSVPASSFPLRKTSRPATHALS